MQFSNSRKPGDASEGLGGAGILLQPNVIEQRKSPEPGDVIRRELPSFPLSLKNLTPGNTVAICWNSPSALLGVGVQPKSVSWVSGLSRPIRRRWSWSSDLECLQSRQPGNCRKILVGDRAIIQIKFHQIRKGGDRFDSLGVDSTILESKAGTRSAAPSGFQAGRR